MDTKSKPKGRPMHELRRIVAEDNARLDELAGAWSALTTPEQEALVKWAKDKAALRS